MSDKPYTKVGNTYYPKPRDIEISENEVKGNRWRAWRTINKCYYEFDIGHFASKFETVEISKDDFERLKARQITDADLTRNYRKT